MESRSRKKRINLFSYLEEYVLDLCSTTPEIISRQSTAPNFSVVVTLDVTKIPFRHRVDFPEDKLLFSGDDLHSPLIAEHKALMSLMKFLEHTIPVEIHDSSHFKIVACQTQQKQQKQSIESLLYSVDSILDQYSTCLNLLDPVFLSAAEYNTEIFIELANELSVLRDQCISAILHCKEEVRQLDKQMRSPCLSADKTIHPNCLQGESFVCTIPPKLLLSDLLNCLDMMPAQYATDLNEDETFRGTCSLNLALSGLAHHTGMSNICGESKATPLEAECSAALRAIHYLERAKDIELVDFNYDTLVTQRDKLFKLQHIWLKCSTVGEQMMRSWSDFADALQGFLDDHFDVSGGSALLHDQPLDFHGLVKWSSQLYEFLFDVKRYQHEGMISLKACINK